jgi:hypothetical protein
MAPLAGRSSGRIEVWAGVVLALFSDAVGEGLRGGAALLTLPSSDARARRLSVRHANFVVCSHGCSPVWDTMLRTTPSNPTRTPRETGGVEG